MSAEQPEFELRLIKSGDVVTGLSLGDKAFQPLKTFLQRDAKRFQDRNLARTYGVFGGSKIVAYITLVCGEVSASDEIRDDEDSFTYDSYPAVKIARLAVDRRNRGGLGKQLVDFALGVVKNQIAPVVGCRFVIVDSKMQSVGFYKKCGFTMINTDVNRERAEPIMFIDLHRIHVPAVETEAPP